MVYVLGVNLPDKKLARIALQAFYGVGEKTAQRLCARLQIHDQQRVRNLSPHQITGLASFLSSPHTAAPLPRLPLATPGVLTQTVNPPPEPNTLQLNRKDPLLKLRIETELKREMRENIAHQQQRKEREEVQQGGKIQVEYDTRIMIYCRICVMVNSIFIFEL
ncbi:S13-like H2TH domain-containing [Pyrrhoderma noxium]|uniref:Small ribosomal subunit protein uS13m n=1 Tax=Pyrrhoderma noxium TaxID=2282107 RepID=A0A286UWL2_9AGAM|nr:S13-like H2TH domain-containing [Pyrrhoderma noxium]